ncbi:hypothetical protein [Yersinia ruckeri]|uniref:hypothetical protein n=1 Tax=Yersinia ruckeri TaxID=29486 RepID=UPI002237312E|nr:hypothetical protein [Yersinia ruckeri]MCW6598721.1 hypothetical protein [Yersinia ruckeri]
MAKIDEIRAQKWNQQVMFQQNVSANSVIASIYKRVLQPFETAHAQVCSTIGFTKGLQLSPVTIAEAESSVVGNGGRLFPNTAYKPNPITYQGFAPFKPPILSSNWVLDNGSNPPNIDTDLSVLEASPNPVTTGASLLKSKDILVRFITLSLSYLSSEEQIKSKNNSDLVSLQSLIELEKTSISYTGGSAGTSEIPPTPPTPVYSAEFISAYLQYRKTRKSSLLEIEKLCVNDAGSVNSLYYQWLEFFCHRTEGAVSKLSMSKRSLEVCKDSLRIAEDKYNILRI